MFCGDPGYCLEYFLCKLTDPFESDGNYGDEVNTIREYVFEQVVSKEAIAANLTNFQVIQQMTSEYLSTDEIQQYRQQLVEDAIQEDLRQNQNSCKLKSIYKKANTNTE